MMNKKGNIIAKAKKTYKTLRYGKRIDEIEVLAPFIEKNLTDTSTNCFIDVGAHHGGATKFFLGANWKVLAFEPDDQNREILQDKFSNNPNITIFDIPLSDKIENLKLYCSDISSGLSSLLNFHETHKEVKEITTNTLKNILIENKIDNVKFLKIDVEGYDLKVLKGVDFEQTNIDLILSEYEDFKTEKLGYTYKDMIDFLSSKGYECIISEWFPIKKYGTRHRWRKFTYDLEKVDKDSWGNIIAIKPEKYQELRNFLNVK